MYCKACHTCTCCGENRRAEQFEGAAVECKACAVESKLCAVCEKLKLPTEFSRSQIHNIASTSRNLFLRCINCHRCTTCRTVKEARYFDGKSKECVKCLNATQKEWACSACAVRKPFTCFDADILRHARFHSKLVATLQVMDR